MVRIEFFIFHVSLARRRQYKDYLRCDLFTCLSVTSVYLWMWITKVKIFFSPYVSLVTTMSEGMSVKLASECLIENILAAHELCLAANEIKSLKTFLHRWQLTSPRVNIHPWRVFVQLENSKHHWICLERFLNSFKENRYFLYFVLLFRSSVISEYVCAFSYLYISYNVGRA